MATKTKTSATEKEVVYASAKRHGIPGWLLWGIYGAENSFNPNNGVQFGLIEGSYPQLNGGKGRTVKNPRNLAETSDVAAELLASLAKEHGGLSGAVSAYSGGEYSITHPRELASSNPSQGKTIFADFPGEILEGAGTILGLNNPESQAHSGSGETGIEAGEQAVQKTGGLLGPIVKPLEQIGEVFKVIGELLFTPEGWVRIGKMVGGAVLFLWGLDVLVKASGNTPSGVSTVKKAIDVAAVVK